MMTRSPSSTGWLTLFNALYIDSKLALEIEEHCPFEVAAVRVGDQAESTSNLRRPLVVLEPGVFLPANRPLICDFIAIRFFDALPRCIRQFTGLGVHCHEMRGASQDPFSRLTLWEESAGPTKQRNACLDIRSGACPIFVA